MLSKKEKKRTRISHGFVYTLETLVYNIFWRRTFYVNATIYVKRTREATLRNSKESFVSYGSCGKQRYTFSSIHHISMYSCVCMWSSSAHRCKRCSYVFTSSSLYSAPILNGIYFIFSWRILIHTEVVHCSHFKTFCDSFVAICI